MLSWLDLYDTIRTDIRSGHLAAESDLSQHKLRPQCSDDDWAEVLRLLRQEGLIESGASRVAVARARSIRTSSFLSDYKNQGRRPTIETLELGLANWESVPTELQNIDESGAEREPFVRHHHVQLVDGVPHAICESFVPIRCLGAEWAELRHGQRDLFELWREAGQAPLKKEERLWFDWASPAEGSWLALEDSRANPVIRLACAVWSTDSVLEYCLLTDRADLYEFRYEVRID